MNNPIEISENSDAVRSRVESAIEFHNKHFLVPIDQLKLEQMLMQDEAKAMLSECAQKHNMSMRGIAKIAKVGRVIANLATSEYVTRIHIAEALMYRKH